MKIGSSLTSRVTWALTGLVATFVAAFCLAAYVIFDQMEDDLVDAVLATQAQQIQEQMSKGEAIPKQLSPAELGASIQGWIVVDRDDAKRLPELLRPLGAGLHLLSPEKQTWHVLVQDTPEGMLYLRYDATAHEDRVTEFGLIMAAVGLFCVLGALLLARWLGRLVVEPMLDLTDRLSTWAPGAPNLRVARDDEMGRLVEVFNRVQNRVEESMAFEREFASNLSHEIRTPLSAIRSDGEMALFDPALSPDVAMRLKRIIASTDAASSSLASALALTRPELSHPVSLSLRQSLDEAWMALQSEAEKTGLVMRNEIPETMRQVLDPYAVLIVMRNLVRNAIEHAAPATLVVGVGREGCLRFSDNGQGIPAQILPLVFERYYSHRRSDAGRPTASGGSRHDGRRGLGLAIAKRVCDLHQWSLSVESRNQGPSTGTTFTLCFSQSRSGSAGSAIAADPGVQGR